MPLDAGIGAFRSPACRPAYPELTLRFDASFGPLFIPRVVSPAGLLPGGFSDLLGLVRFVFKLELVYRHRSEGDAFRCMRPIFIPLLSAARELRSEAISEAWPGWLHAAW